MQAWRAFLTAASIVAKTLNCPPSPLFSGPSSLSLSILLPSCPALWINAPKVRSLYFGSITVTFFSFLLVWLQSYTMMSKKGKHNNNPEASLSTFGLPSVFDLYFESLPFFFVCMQGIFNDLRCAFVDEMRNEEMERVWMRGMWSSSRDLGEKDCLWRGSSLPALMTVIFLLEHLMAEQHHSPHASRAHLTWFFSFFFLFFLFSFRMRSKFRS